VAGLVACDGEVLGERSITVFLGFSDHTNFGPETATGTAVIDTPTGRVELSVAGMPPLGGERYEGWLRGGGEDPLSLGTFDTSEQGAASMVVTLGDLREATFERVVITVEPDPDPDPDRPDVRETISGEILK
jgi:Anti-sigma-K factor rskA